MKPWFFQLHRWLALAFAIPLGVLIVTGLILSFEPIAQRTGGPHGTVSADVVSDILRTHDPQGKARGLAYRAYDSSVTLIGPGLRQTVRLDAASAKADESGLAGLFGASRRLHEHFTVFNLEVTIASTCVMVALIAFGILLGLPKLRNTAAGWHKGVAWFGLPLLVLSPLTGLFIAWGVTLNTADTPRSRAAPLPLADAVRTVAAKHDLANLIWIRERGGQQLARLWDGEEARVFVVSGDGLRPVARNVSRLIHEGNFLGAWSGALNAAISLAFVALLATGLWLFGRREMRAFAGRRRRARALAASPGTLNDPARTG